VKVGMTAKVEVPSVRVASGNERQHTQQQAQDEANEIEEFPCHFISPNLALYELCH
jgi:hypothetical protein